MRLVILIVAIVLGSGCAARQGGPEKPGPIVKYGVIVAKEVVDMDEVKRQSKVDTRFHASISSGGGFAIGLGFLLSPLMSSETPENPVRYDIELVDGGKTTIYHLSSLFEIDDCVEITVYPDEKKHPPEMVRSKDGCDP